MKYVNFRQPKVGVPGAAHRDSSWTPVTVGWTQNSAVTSWRIGHDTSACCHVLPVGTENKWWRKCRRTRPCQVDDVLLVAMRGRSEQSADVQVGRVWKRFRQLGGKNIPVWTAVLDLLQSACEAKGSLINCNLELQPPMQGMGSFHFCCVLL